MDLGELPKEEAIARLGEINPRTGKKAAIQGSDDRHEDNQRNQAASAGAEDAVGHGGADVIARSDFGDRENAQISHVRQQVNGDACDRPKGQRKKHISLRVADLAGNEAQLHPAVIGQQRCDQRDAEAANGESAGNFFRNRRCFAAPQEGAADDDEQAGDLGQRERFLNDGPGGDAAIIDSSEQRDRADPEQLRRQRG